MTTYRRSFTIVANLLAHLWCLKQRTLTSVSYNVDSDTGSLAGLFPSNAEQVLELECNIISVEDWTCSSNIRTSDTYSPVPLVSLSHSVDAEVQGSSGKYDDDQD